MRINRLLSLLAVMALGCTPPDSNPNGNPPATIVDMAVAAGPDLASRCASSCVAPTPFCNQSGNCVACLADKDCPVGQVCHAFGNNASCVPGCNDDSRCQAQKGSAMSCCGNACVDTGMDPANCGGCGKACSVENAVPACAGGACKLGQCYSGFADCNNDPTDGCEVSLHTDAQNCGGCGMACNIKNAISGCSDGCYIRACNFGYDDCNSDPTDGCETPTLSDANNCGGCGMACGKPAHSTAGCFTGYCGIKSCDFGYADCNGNAMDGCEVSVGSDANNCGKCGNVCPQGLVCVMGGCTCPQCNIPNAKTKCINNMCVMDSCLPGFADCNNNAQDGCEVNLNLDASNCGQCKNVCPQGQTCGNGMCGVPVCMRVGWKTGNANWACPNGLRLPTVNEWNKVLPCITQQDMAMFGYYYDVAVSVGGCNCKWNMNWCGQPSVETIRGGRMCGDFQQLQICVN